MRLSYSLGQGISVGHEFTARLRSVSLCPMASNHPRGFYPTFPTTLRFRYPTASNRPKGFSTLRFPLPYGSYHRGGFSTLRLPISLGVSESLRYNISYGIKVPTLSKSLYIQSPYTSKVLTSRIPAALESSPLKFLLRLNSSP